MIVRPLTDKLIDPTAIRLHEAAEDQAEHDIDAQGSQWDAESQRRVGSQVQVQAQED